LLRLSRAHFDCCAILYILWESAGFADCAVLEGNGIHRMGPGRAHK